MVYSGGASPRADCCRRRISRSRSAGMSNPIRVSGTAEGRRFGKLVKATTLTSSGTRAPAATSPSVAAVIRLSSAMIRPSGRACRPGCSSNSMMCRAAMGFLALAKCSQRVWGSSPCVAMAARNLTCINCAWLAQRMAIRRRPRSSRWRTAWSMNPSRSRPTFGTPGSLPSPATAARGMPGWSIRGVPSSSSALEAKISPAIRRERASLTTSSYSAMSR